MRSIYDQPWLVRSMAVAALAVALGACANGGDGTADGEVTPADTMAAAPFPAASGEQAAPAGEAATP